MSRTTTAEVRHWDKTIFVITVSSVARQFGVRHNTLLDIKVLDDPEEVADLKRKVIGFLKKLNPNAFVKRSHIEIHDVDYAIACELVP